MLSAVPEAKGGQTRIVSSTRQNPKATAPERRGGSLALHSDKNSSKDTAGVLFSFAVFFPAAKRKTNKKNFISHCWIATYKLPLSWDTHHRKNQAEVNRLNLGHENSKRCRKSTTVPKVAVNPVEIPANGNRRAGKNVSAGRHCPTH
jgi:hypothetical protein